MFGLGASTNNSSNSIDDGICGVRERGCLDEDGR